MTSRRPRTARTTAALLVAIVALPACGGGGGGADDPLPGAASTGSLRLGDIGYDVVNVDCVTMPTGRRLAVVEGRHDGRILSIDLHQDEGDDEGELSGTVYDSGGVVGAGVFTDDEWAGFDGDRIEFTGRARLPGGPDADETGTLSLAADCPPDDSPGAGTITVDGTTAEVNVVTCAFGSDAASLVALLVDEDDDSTTSLFVGAGGRVERIDAEVPGADEVEYEQSTITADGRIEPWEPTDRIEREWQVPDGPVVAAAVDCGLMRRLP